MRPAVLALAIPYQPAVGDVVLVIGDDELYVIGVLSGRGISRLEVPGDLELSAGGSVRIQGGRGVSLNAPDVAVKAHRLEMTAERLLGRFGRVYEWIRETLKTSAERIRTTVREGVSIRAGRIDAIADKDVKIDGRRIHLG
ncbi:MAG: DUF3540 domain-containing protein [Planctomycetota bacterium]